MDINEQDNTFASEPRLPWDVLHLIFEEANPSTLAVLGAVSFDVLAATSKLLYRQPKLVDVEAVASLFSWRHDSLSSSSSRLSPYLSLTQIRHLSLDVCSARRILPKLNTPVSLARSPAFGPLLLDSLHLVYPSASRFPELFDASLASLVNPTRCHFDVRGRSRERWPWTKFADSSPVYQWDRTELLEFSGVASFGRGGWVEGIRRRRVVRLHLETLLSSYASATKFLEFGREEDLGFEAMRVGAVELVVRSEWTKRDVLEVLEKSFGATKREAFRVVLAK